MHQGRPAAYKGIEEYDTSPWLKVTVMGWEITVHAHPLSHAAVGEIDVPWSAQ